MKGSRKMRQLEDTLVSVCSGYMMREQLSSEHKINAKGKKRKKPEEPKFLGKRKD
jgi:hypothetical protein